jgi:hypothetical protein
LDIKGLCLKQSAERESHRLIANRSGRFVNMKATHSTALGSDLRAICSLREYFPNPNQQEYRTECQNA